MSIVTKKLEEKLIVKDLTRYKLSKLLDYSEGTLNQMARGERPFPDALIDKICDVLNIPKDEFQAWLLADKYSKETIQTAITELNNRKYNETLILTQRIDEKLQEKHLSRTALSKLIKYDQSSVNRMIIGKDSMSKTVITRIAPILEVSEETIIGWILADKYSLKVLILALKY